MRKRERESRSGVSNFALKLHLSSQFLLPKFPSLPVLQSSNGHLCGAKIGDPFTSKIPPSTAKVVALFVPPLPNGATSERRTGKGIIECAAALSFSPSN